MRSKPSLNISFESWLLFCESKDLLFDILLSGFNLRSLCRLLYRRNNLLWCCHCTSFSYNITIFNTFFGLSTDSLGFLIHLNHWRHFFLNIFVIFDDRCRKLHSSTSFRNNFFGFNFLRFFLLLLFLPLSLFLLCLF